MAPMTPRERTVMNISRSMLAAGAAAVLLLVSGCGSTPEESPDAAPQSQSSEMSSSAPAPKAPEASSEAGAPAEETEEMAEEVVITVEDFEFDISGSVSPGATITVVNKDSAPHTVTSEEEGLFDATFEGGETVTFTAPEEPGEYPFICTIHPAMTGTLVVE